MRKLSALVMFFIEEVGGVNFKFKRKIKYKNKFKKDKKHKPPKWE